MEYERDRLAVIFANYSAVATSAYIFIGLPLSLFLDMSTGPFVHLYYWISSGAIGYLIYRLPSRGVRGREEFVVVVSIVAMTPVFGFATAFVLWALSKKESLTD